MMVWFIFFMILYGMTGVFISIKLFKNAIGKIAGAIYFSILWAPALIADIIVKNLEKE